MAQVRMPQAKEAEECLLGLMMQSDECVSAAYEEGITERDFYSPACRLVYRAVMEVRDTGMKPDIVSVTGRLRDKGELAAAGGEEYIARLYEMADSQAKAPQYIEIIRRKSLLRQLIRAADEIRKSCLEEGYNEEEVLADAQARIAAVSSMNRGRDNFQSTKDVTGQIVSEILNMKDHPVRSLKTGFSALDNCTSGFKPGELVILAARTGIGKTAFSVNIAVNAGCRLHKNVAFFTLEMPVAQIVRRMLAVDMMIPARALKTGDLTMEMENQLLQAEQDLSGAGIYIDDSSVIKVPEIMGRCRSLKNELKKKDEDLDLVIVDYLQLVTAARESDNRQQDVSEISRGLKKMARELECPVIALAQLSRETERHDVPVLSDLRESGAIEQDADIVMFLYNTPQKKGQAPIPDSEMREMVLAVAKNRDGSLMKKAMSFTPDTMKFSEMAQEGEWE